MQRLTVNYRQANDPDFQRALQAARRGEPAQCVAALHGKINFAQFVDMGFPGLTLYGVNDDVASHNNAKLKAIDSPLIKDEADLWGEKPLTEWKDILQPTYVKVGAQVRVTANQTPGFAYVNGDIATLLEYNPGQFAIVELHRGERTQVMVNKVTRLNLRGLHYGEEPPTNCNGMEVPKEWTEPEDRSKYQAYIAHCMSQRRAFYDPKTRKWVIGAITYVPIALGWASTFHKAQGLTADMLQIDISNQFSGQPQMMYVALSRCRKASNITITRGDPAKLVSRIRHHPDTKPYM
jgi:hypothetical protein